MTSDDRNHQQSPTSNHSTKKELIGKISNYYGGLWVMTIRENPQHLSKYYWGIGDYNGIRWERITHRLYRELIRFEKNRSNSEIDKEPLLSELDKSYKEN